MLTKSVMQELTELLDGSIETAGTEGDLVMEAELITLHDLISQAIRTDSQIEIIIRG